MKSITELYYIGDEDEAEVYGVFEENLFTTSELNRFMHRDAELWEEDDPEPDIIVICYDEVEDNEDYDLFDNVPEDFINKFMTSKPIIAYSIERDAFITCIWSPLRQKLLYGAKIDDYKSILFSPSILTMKNIPDSEDDNLLLLG